jgi:hypothetical protein
MPRNVRRRSALLGAIFGVLVDDLGRSLYKEQNIR